MKTTYIIAIAVVVIVIIGSVFAYVYIAAAPSKSTTTPTLAKASIIGSGGSLVNPLMQTWVSAYEIDEPQIAITYTPTGSGTGITQFQDQLTNFGESDVPLQAKDISGLPSGTTALIIPISCSAVTIAYNLKLVNGSECKNGINFDGAVLADIFLGTITKWNDPAIQALQSSTLAAQLPAQPITVVHRSDSSGTMYAFTSFLTDASSVWASKVGASKSPAWPTGIGADLNAGVAAAIAENPDSIGPLEIAYVLQNPGALYYGNVQNAAGNFITPSVASAEAAESAGATGLPAGNDAAAWSSVSVVNSIFNDTAATTAYPITTLTYALLYENLDYAGLSAAQAAATVNFLHWIINDGQTLGPSLGYVPLPANIVAIDNTTLSDATYNGTPITIIT